ncbi:hypothetical protein [Hydrogenophaga sp. 2FB]|uniref:hypothetical protein n=1 Tax=Hydrogenophaga sp. 2FB TaxID=2502187 RepID=UPI0010F8341A|nr:hypothetical protein [Hydrogenophaga sp. 2FB]
MPFLDDDKHQKTLELLAEAVDYLNRLPHVPATRDLSARLQAHLDEPSQMLVARRRPELHGGIFSAAGLPLLEVAVVDEVARIQYPQDLRTPDWLQASAEVRKLLAAGPVSVPLKARTGEKAE